MDEALLVFFILCGIDLTKEFSTHGRVVEGSDVVHGNGVGILFGYTSHLHAEVACLYNDHHTKRVEGFLDAFGYLFGHTLLNL